MSSTASSTATLTVLFCDVVGSTERLVRIGDVAGDSLRHDLFAGLRRSVDAGGGVEVKHLGDGLMAVFPRSAVGALVCAREMHRAAAAIDPVDPIQLRIGISAGEVAEEEGDWFGLPVVEAARLCAAAAAEQTLASSLIRTLVGTRAADHRIREIGMLQLKGLSGPLSVVEIEWRTDSRVLQPTPSGAGPATSSAGSAVSVSTPGPAPTPPVDPSGGPDGPDGPGGPERSVGLAGRAGRGRRRTIVVVVIVAVAGLLGLAISEFGGDGSEGVQADVTAPPSDVVTNPQGYEPRLRNVACARPRRAPWCRERSAAS